VGLSETLLRDAGRVLTAALLAILLAASATSTASAAPSGDQRPYDARLMRLSEILGAVHYLRELCEHKDGMRWRNSINELVKTEGTTALRRATIARRFNLGYRSYRRTYRNCTPSAKNTIARFFKEAIEISQGLIKLGQ
jgi:uncharacterized protein (TIGR02301 family)